jgi:hypothetical protein
MDLLVLFAIGALLCGAAAFIRMPQMPRFWLLLAIASVPQLGLLCGVEIAGMGWVSIATVALWGYANRRVPGVAVISAGMLMNLVAMALHGGRMPIHADVLTQLGAAVPAGTILAGSKDIVVDSSPLLWLSDHIVLGSGGHTYIASMGDFVVLLGIVGWLTLSESPENLIIWESPERNTAHARAVYTRPT